MKIALVNLSRVQDFSKTKYYASSLEFLQENSIDFVDYFSGRDTPDELLNGFHEALKNKDVELVWFIQGGNELIKFLDKIDWDLVEQSNKEYLGLSDFTHFALRAAALGQVCYYGQGLKQIKEYIPTSEQRMFVVDFLKTKKLPAYNARLIYGDENVKLEKEKVVGGHSFVSAIMLPGMKLEMNNRFLFFEHHYMRGEDLKDAGYFLDAIKLNLKTKPKGIILGHSILFNKDGSLMDIELINNYFRENLTDLHLPIYYIDHFKTIIKFS